MMSPVPTEKSNLPKSLKGSIRNAVMPTTDGETRLKRSGIDSVQFDSAAHIAGEDRRIQGISKNRKYLFILLKLDKLKFFFKIFRKLNPEKSVSIFLPYYRFIDDGFWLFYLPFQYRKNCYWIIFYL